MEQTDEDWNWLIVLNGDAINPHYKDLRIKIIKMPFESKKIGKIKSFSFEQVDEGIGVELDHDDLLSPDATCEIKKAFEDDEVGFVYSNFAEFQDKTWKPNRYGERFGWTYKQEIYKGHIIDIPNQFPLYPSTMGLIFFAPNHIRSWKMNVYREIGGHVVEMAVADDHDLVCRFYLKTKMHKIEKCIYLYRMYENNSHKVYNNDIQTGTQMVFKKHIKSIINRWCDLNDLKKIDICCGNNKPLGYIGVDKMESADITCDLNERFPLEDNSVGVIKATDAIEHLRDPIHTMNECYRVLAHGGWLMIDVPSTDGRGAFQDPTHVSFFNSNSFWYYTKKQYADFVPDIKCRFQEQRIVNYIPTKFHKDYKIPYVEALLVAIKDGPRLQGELEI